MARTVRRQPLVNKPPAKAPSFRPAGVARPAKKPADAGTSGGGGGTSAAPARRRAAFPPQPVRDVVSELRKVTWPTREETTRLAFAVIVVSIAMGLLLGGVDFGFNWLVDNTLLR